MLLEHSSSDIFHSVPNNTGIDEHSATTSVCKQVAVNIKYKTSDTKLKLQYINTLQYSPHVSTVHCISVLLINALCILY
jgi:hypothetical protein